MRFSGKVALPFEAEGTIQHKGWSIPTRYVIDAKGQCWMDDAGGQSWKDEVHGRVRECNHPLEAVTVEELLTRAKDSPDKQEELRSILLGLML